MNKYTPIRVIKCYGLTEHITTSYRALVHLLGEPHWQGPPGDKSRVNWEARPAGPLDGQYVAVWNCNALDTPLRALREWSLHASSPAMLRQFKADLAEAEREVEMEEIKGGPYRLRVGTAVVFGPGLQEPGIGVNSISPTAICRLMNVAYTAGRRAGRQELARTLDRGLGDIRAMIEELDECVP